MDYNTIRSEELDAMARRGFGDMVACFNGEADEARWKNADLALKLLNVSTRRMSSQTNRAAVAFKIAREMKMSPENLQPLWEQLAPVSRTQPVLEAKPEEAK